MFKLAGLKGRFDPHFFEARRIALPSFRMLKQITALLHR
jgi:hypothetical protein